MPRPKRWVEDDVIDGVSKITFSSWAYFYDYVRTEMLDYSHYFWRGQANSNWSLESSLDRQLSKLTTSNKSRLASRHLERFKLATRGRRGVNPSRLEDDNDWWALGQHQGLSTPLLDWTQSPFVALYFAFFETGDHVGKTRAIWALGPIESKNREIRNESDKESAETPPNILEVIRPPQDENTRLVNQAGLFTRAPLGTTVDSWVAENFSGITNRQILLKMVIRDVEREKCLKTLNKMNINHLTLFPDLFGAAEYCNMVMRIPKY